MQYPVLITDHRRFDDAYTGDLTVSDIDGTYLATDLTSLRKALAIPFQFAVDKTTIPGAVSLLRELRHGAGERSAFVPLYFVSASPPQLRMVLERKMLLDGVEFDGISFKDQLRLALRGRMGELRHQAGYKLTALVEYRRRLPMKTRWRLLGDDLESDAVIYTLFGRLCAGLRGRALEQEIVKAGADEDVAEAIAAAAQELPYEDPVAAIYIHLTKGRDPQSFPPGAIAVRDHLQAALAERAAGRLAPGACKRVAAELVGLGLAERIPGSLEDAAYRLAIPGTILDEARAALP
jgi:hypothetical protein